ncbi:GGDEF domain-containing protein [Nitrosophilus labii]|uniref:GGDEF domain-containing protein n=1 Tax=Nitrosophilus labii TaxID=2706014 RepID=UPI001657619B|nr:GGDEF domain-containing protein [Nitrosophilus labii]
MKINECIILKKLENGEKFSKEDIKTIMNIVRQEMNFMIRNNILITPKNYERWFYVFCYIVESQKELNDLEILGLFKEIYDEPYDEVKEYKEENNFDNPKGFVKKLNLIAKSIDKKLLEIIYSLDKHADTIDNHTEFIIDSKEKIEHKTILKSIDKILEELNNLKNENKKLTKELKKYHKDVLILQEELKIAKTEAEMDFLTGLVNRRRFERALLELINDLQTKNYPFSLVILDIDDFKKINDKYGHPIGDMILQEIANILKNFLRANAIASRIGGEEFAVILPGSELQQAKHIAERLRKAIENRTFNINEIKTTASFGVTEAKKTDTLESIFERADKALYDAKKSGKNCVKAVK